MPTPGSTVTAFHSTIGEVVIRYPRPGDGPALLEYINSVSREQTFISFQGEQLTLEQEEAWLRDRLAEIETGTNVTLAAVLGDRVVGATGIGLKPLAERHIGVLGISIAEDLRGQGLGARLFTTVIAEAEKHLPELRIIELGVFANNELAYHLYQKHGFIEYGRLPGGILRRGEYVDHIYMYREVGSTR